ncbi:helix-turn-helix transcriptional regulator [Clostridium sp. HBUAS56017]|uniref:helix-turn-helix domain-containing protein n=1 Tax=Clostridium sp. HBUAS56017 TaxID=2571128 RepID=UPI0011784388|nr:helix-turn-helix transcriptional regulator [Clostridium sp. HBUAS56017]
MINKNPKIRLKYYREQKGISQKELAEKVETSQSYISEIEKNLKSPTIRMLYHISEVLEICPHLLLPCIIDCKGRNNCNLCEGNEIDDKSSYL